MGVSAPFDSWRSPEKLVEIGFDRSRVVMMNEAHDGEQRCVRTRRVGQQVLAAVRQSGARYLAMEAIRPSFAAEANQTRAVPATDQSYLAQPEMRDFIATALALGFTLVSYEADRQQKPHHFAPSSLQETNWREEQQAHNLIAVLQELSDHEKLFVWCGNGHLTKRRVADWLPMGLRFWELSGLESFAIDQTVSVRFNDRERFAGRWVKAYQAELAARGGVAGFLTEDVGDDWPFDNNDAYLLALDNTLH
jgi:erythromycin esterase-like protein